MTVDRATKAQRLRVRFARGPEAAEIGQLDLARAWERAFEEAGIVLSLSQGNRPQPRLTLAAGLASGVTSDGELLDVILAQPIEPGEALERLRSHLPAGLEALDGREVGMGLPSLPSSVRWADYEVDVPGAGVDIDAALAAFLARDRIDWEDTRGERTRHYDLRPLVGELRVDRRCGDIVRLGMRLRCGPEGVGRPDQVVKALGLPEAVRVHRLRLHVVEASPARTAWRRRGKYVT